MAGLVFVATAIRLVFITITGLVTPKTDVRRREGSTGQAPGMTGEMYVPGRVAPSWSRTDWFQVSSAWVKSLGGVITSLSTEMSVLSPEAAGR
jgi:hypothetical protein